MAVPANPLVRDVLPLLADGIHDELVALNETALASQVEELRVGDPCRCGDDFCQSFYIPGWIQGTVYPRDRHRTVPLLPDGEMVNLDVVDDRIVFVEILL